MKNSHYEIFTMLGKSFLVGAKNLKQKSGDFFGLLVFLITLLAFIAYFELHVKIMLFFAPELTRNAFFVEFALWNWWVSFFVFALTFSLWGLMASGLRSLIEIRGYQKSLDRIMKGGTESRGPKILKVIKDSSNRMKLVILGQSLGFEEFLKRAGNLAASFSKSIENIQEGRTPSLTIITLNQTKLKDKYEYNDLKGEKGKNDSFIVGQSSSGIVQQQIKTLPHLLIAGTTGGGKSQFFKQTLLRLLETSHNIQMYLIDLKGGIEMKCFGKLPHVQVASTITNALSILELVHNEMQKRFDYLNEKDKKEIDPKKDKRDRIVIGIDESSILYTLKTRDSENFKKTLKAREITDEIAKLGRAAAIHLILATQKVTAKTIDTSIQENITGKMCFRMNTLQGSLLVLGNKAALTLPPIPGRGIWSVGNKVREVQAPYLSERELEKSLKALKKKGKGKKKALKMLRCDDTKNDNKDSQKLANTLHGRPSC